MGVEQVKVCPFCRHENNADATQCARCGVSFVSEVTTTLSVPGEIADEVREDLVVRRTKLPEGSMALYLMGEKVPVLIEASAQPIILGRKSPDNPAASIIDLTHYQAHMLGVSRQHAAISYSTGSFTIEDLNSSNGTWVNENRLPANQPRVLRNGDVVRLGQLIIFVYLH